MPIAFDGQVYKDELEYTKASLSSKELSDRWEMASNETSGDFDSRFGAVETAPRMPLEATEKLTDAFKSDPGMVTPGNIDLTKRPVVKNEDGSISTVRSMSVNFDGQETLIPTVAHDGSRVLSNDEAIQQYKDTGLHLGIFKTPEHASAYAEQLHKDQAARYTLPDVGKPLIGDGGTFSEGTELGNALVKAWTDKTTPKPEPTVLFPNKNPLLNITDHDIDKAVDVALSAGPGTLESVGSKVSAYIDMFLKKPKQQDTFANYIKELEVQKAADPNYLKPFKPEPGSYEPGSAMAGIAPTKPLSTFDQAYKDIVEALDGPGAYEKELAKIAESKSTSLKNDLENNPVVTKANTPDSMFEQVPYSPEVGHHLKPLVASGMYQNYVFLGKDEAAAKLWSDYAAKSTSKQWAEFKEQIGNKTLEETLEPHHPWEVLTKQGQSEFPHSTKTPHGWDVVGGAEKDAAEAAPNMWDKALNAVNLVQAKLLNSVIHERAKYHTERLKETIPKEAAKSGYETTAFRGLKNKNEILSEHNFNKNNLMYSSDSPLLADMYADYLSKHPGWNVKEGAFGEGATVAPLLINTKDYHVYDAAGADWTMANHKAVREAREEGKPGVIVKNVWDEPNSTKALGKPVTVYITFPTGASTVKSRFAQKFDKSSSNMLHLIPVIGVGGAAGYVSKQSIDSE